MKKKIQPLGRNVLVKVRKVEKMTESGIVIPDTASEKNLKKEKWLLLEIVRK